MKKMMLLTGLLILVSMIFSVQRAECAVVAEGEVYIEWMEIIPSAPPMQPFPFYFPEPVQFIYHHEPLADYEIVLEYFHPEERFWIPLATTITDGFGRFTFNVPSPPNGDYRIRFAGFPPSVVFDWFPGDHNYIIYEISL